MSKPKDDIQGKTAKQETIQGEKGPALHAPLSGIRGLLRHFAPNQPVTLEEMDEAICEEVVRRFERSFGS